MCFAFPDVMGDYMWKCVFKQRENFYFKHSTTYEHDLCIIFQSKFAQFSD